MCKGVKAVIAREKVKPKWVLKAIFGLTRVKTETNWATAWATFWFWVNCGHSALIGA